MSVKQAPAMHERARDLPLDPHPDRLRNGRPRRHARRHSDLRLRAYPLQKAEAGLLDETEHGEETERPQ
jgi:hypothetical protein